MVAARDEHLVVVAHRQGLVQVAVAGASTDGSRVFFLTVEALVSEARFAHLFTDEEREIARKRLADFGYALSA